MHFLMELVISLLLVIGGMFVLVGSLGLIKLPDLMTRLHAPTKATTLGMGGTLIASMLYFLATDGALSIHEILITLFLFITAPVTAHFITKAWLHQNPSQSDSLPPTGRELGWSTFEAVPDEAREADAPPESAQGPQDPGIPRR